MELSYGRCPVCNAPGKMRERRINGNDVCENNHTYPSVTSIHEDPNNIYRVSIPVPNYDRDCSIDQELYFKGKKSPSLKEVRDVCLSLHDRDKAYPEYLNGWMDAIITLGCISEADFPRANSPCIQSSNIINHPSLGAVSIAVRKLHIHNIIH